MSGHSKWSKVKHQKATTDVVKSFAFTKASRAITIAVKEGGGVVDPSMNFHLRLAMEKARAVNMPKENIERAIAHAKGDGAAIEQIVYEGYGPGGVAVMVETATDNRQRTVSQVKNVLERSGGSLGAPGAVGYLFQRRGVITVPKEGLTLDVLTDMGIEIGADDIVDAADLFEVYTPDHTLFAVKNGLEAKKVSIDNAVRIMQPITTIAVSADGQTKIDTMVGELEALDDVQTVYTNIA